MKIILLVPLLLLLLNVVNAQEMPIDEGILKYYLKTNEVKRQHELTKAKIELLKAIKECQELGFDCYDNASLTISPLKRIANESAEVQADVQKELPPPQHNFLPLPQVINVVNGRADLLDHLGQVHQSIDVGYQLHYYQVETIALNQVIFVDMFSRKERVQIISWQQEQKINNPK